MIAALLLARLAAADDTETYQRLFGSEPVAASAPAAPVEAPSPWRLAGPAALGAVGLFLAWRMRAVKPGVGPGKPLEVICRQPLGDRNALVLLEVVDADGERRRLLVGTGGGAPSLVADLGQAPVGMELAAPVAVRRAELERAPEAPPRVEAEPAAEPSRAPNIAEEVLAERRAATFEDALAARGVRTDTAW